MNAELDPDRPVKIASNVFAREFDGELVVLDLGRGEYYGLNEVGGRLFRGLEGGRTMRQVADQIAAEFEVSTDQSLSDMSVLASALRGLGLIEQD